MISQEILEKAANDSALVQRIELMVWRYMDQSPGKRDAISLAMAIIKEVREADGKPSTEQDVKPTRTPGVLDDPSPFDKYPVRPNDDALSQAELDAASKDAKSTLPDWDIEDEVRRLDNNGFSAPRIVQTLRKEGEKITLNRVYNILAKP